MTNKTRNFLNTKGNRTYSSEAKLKNQNKQVLKNQKTRTFTQKQTFEGKTRTF